MKNKLIILIVIIFSYSVSVSSQEQNYAHSKVTLKTGELIKVNNIKIIDSKVTFSKYNSTMGSVVQYEYTFEEIEDIRIPTKTCFIPGTITGAGVGVITMIIVKKQIEKPEEIYGPGWTATVEKTMGLKPKVLIIAGSTAIGALIGLTIKSGYQSILPGSSSLLRSLKIDFAFNPVMNYSPMLNVCLKF